ncbi:hypothetical protein LG047_14035 [Methylocystis sp. WRRC1]|uniref:hypothetical protein n=1 Tax=Methylocystis sp. WRRC1 TaxID=1732014 RepID=UPI001D14EE68|nr:hypothetical protein [Methylocystis sp. WRRC1]MCC3246423.1 hypothetical protein [Methylocystis sp. WRRC1]
MTQDSKLNFACPHSFHKMITERHFVLRAPTIHTIVMVVFAVLASLAFNPGEFDAGAMINRAWFIFAILLVALFIQFGQTITITGDTITRTSLIGRPRTHTIADISSISEDNQNAGWFVPTATKIVFRDGDQITFTGIDSRSKADAISYIQSRRSEITG